MKYILLVSFLIYLSDAADLGCKRFTDATTDIFGISADVIGVCLGTYLEGTTDGLTTIYQTSQQYVCEDNGDGGYNVVSKTYTNADCTEDDETESVTVQTNQNYIDCESPGNLYIHSYHFRYFIRKNAPKKYIKDAQFMNGDYMTPSQMAIHALRRYHIQKVL